MDILMPQLGETVTEGKVVTWYKSVGDSVAAGDSLFEIETDKTTMEVPTTVAGVLSSILVQVGATVPVGAVVAVLAGSATPAQETAKPETAATKTTIAKSVALDPFNAVRTPEKTFGPATLSNGAKATPLARRLAVSQGIDLATIKGSGPHGRVVAKDVRVVEAGNNEALHAAPAASAASAATTAQIKRLFADIPFEEIPLDGMRKTIARRLLEAKQTVPHFYLTSDIEMDKLLALRGEANAHSGGLYKLSVNDFVIKALALALRKVPQANVVWAEDRLLRFKRSDIGVAVAIEGGLITPIVRSADAKSIGAISQEMKTLAELARLKSLKPAEYQGGSIAVSNLGMYGVRSFSAIINPPQAAILAVGAADRRPLEGPDGQIRFGSVMTATLSCDHRAIDGALGAQLLAAFKELMQSPIAMLV
jgi:pyruvate dehydrogenase E2 component (dihydrolipoamide acetyltransferase)